jgi:hypothetical protein
VTGWTDGGGATSSGGGRGQLVKGQGRGARWKPFSVVGEEATDLTIPQIFTRARGPLGASAHEVGTAQVRVLIGCMFVEIVTKSETCHICRAVLLTI